ncbi:DegT/DnrJ/EryC1/StrS family aminotransferase [Mucilaginibacter sp.]|uniref:DegT/DnrJ/EryC1/StrS family aminotransferase n=1 Tax=Mucilaginibacter sp. TaxID=1882438 RepID=UPI0032677F5E
MQQKGVPFFSFDHTSSLIRAEIKQAFNDFFESQWYILGNKLTEFETEYARFNKTQYCIGVANGLDALHIALKTLNIGPGDEVIVPSNTFVATWLAASYTGTTIVPVEPDEATYNIDPTKIEAAITAKTKAIIPVHLYGQPCEMDRIMAIAGRHNLFVVEDNAQAHSATYNGKLTGSFGNINATSFYPTKNFGALGDAGALTTDNGALDKKARLLRNYGSAEKYQHEVVGFNSRLDEVQAAFLSVKLKYLDILTKQRKDIAAIYNQNLKSIDDIILPYTAPLAGHVYHIYAIHTSKRDALQQYLKDKGIGTLIHYPTPPHLQQAYQNLGYKKGDFPIAEKLAETTLSLPLFPGMETGQIEEVISAIRSFYE